MSQRNGPVNLHYHNAIKSTISSAVYTPTTNIITDPLTDKYTVGENIGRGKFAVVRKCTNKQTNEVVAAKFIKKRRRGKSCREEILREVVMLEMALDHPRLVNLKEVYETQHELVLITEYCAGGELFTECILEEKFDESDVRLLMAQILEGLVYLHEKNIVHLDLKPQNILLTDEFPKGSVKICDLGFACLVNTGEDIRDIIGTPDYVAPEVLNYDSLGLYTDMWSLGVLTYVMLTTCSPFAAEDKQMTFSNITTVNFEFPEELFSNISLSAQDFITKLLVSEPGDRMTAKECFEHEWLQGVLQPSKPLIPCDSDNQDISSSEISNSIPRNKSLGVLVDNDIGYDDAMKMSTANELQDSDTDSNIQSEKKFELQSSQMSVQEDEGFAAETETDLQTKEESVHLNEPDIKSVDLNEPVKDPRDIEPLSLENPTIQTVISEESHKNANVPSYNLMSGDDRTPDTDSDTKLLESDSGMVTGSECRSVESVDLSGRTSAEPEFSENIENTRNYVNDDFEMQNKDTYCENTGSIEDMSNEIDKSVNTGCEENVESILSDNDMDVESVTDPEIIQMNENNSAKNITIRNQITNDLSIESDSNSRDIFNTSTCSDSVNDNQSFSLNDEQRSPIFSCFNDENKYASTPTPLTEPRPHLNSVGNIDDSINSMQLGERHKRGMCNDPNLSGADNADNEDPEYEFVSVSKRVRSIEEAITDPTSPKIARSPRIARNSRFHPHQHH